MGLYDNIELFMDVPLPEYIPRDLQKYFKVSFERNGFQTKSLGSFMDNYVILNDGYLYLGYNNVTQVEIDRTVNICTNVYFTDDVCWEQDANWIFVEIDLNFVRNKLSSMVWISPTEKNIKEFINSKRIG
jgi:hypothetical protein